MQPQCAFWGQVDERRLQNPDCLITEGAELRHL